MHAYLTTDHAVFRRAQEPLRSGSARNASAAPTSPTTISLATTSRRSQSAAGTTARAASSRMSRRRIWRGRGVLLRLRGRWQARRAPRLPADDDPAARCLCTTYPHALKFSLCYQDVIDPCFMLYSFVFPPFTCQSFCTQCLHSIAQTPLLQIYMLLVYTI